MFVFLDTQEVVWAFDSMAPLHFDQKNLGVAC